LARLQQDAIGNVMFSSEAILSEYTHSRNGTMALTGSLAEEFVHAQSTVNQGSDLRMGFVVAKNMQQEPLALAQNDIHMITLPEDIQMDSDHVEGIAQDPGQVMLNENITHLLVTQLMPTLCPQIGRYSEMV